MCATSRRKRSHVRARNSLVMLLQLRPAHASVSNTNINRRFFSQLSDYHLSCKYFNGYSHTLSLISLITLS
ncbi:hypothetical protein TELCIR_23464 [Teladorsagia circumcincta]|uniref:Secreted protein n=1 Tax=Teladorsagia circumcincta TaxID=45464 RepID=A0A2G9TC87_TELCI|nr:hypothetical protein TELCIR_23464 [Teladorsagia circumcincta]